MKQKLIALLCALVLTISLMPMALALPDEGTRAAETLHTLHIVNGSKGGYEVNRAPTRLEAVLVLTRLLGVQQEAANAEMVNRFTDLPTWCDETLSYAYRQGWDSGASSTTFGANEPIDTNRFCAMLLKALGYQKFEFYEAEMFARHIGLISTDQTLTGKDFTRGDLFVMAAESLTFHYANTDETVIERLVEKGLTTEKTARDLGYWDAPWTARQMADRCMAAVFCIDGFETKEHILTNEPDDKSSGYFISKDGIAVTNYHGLKDCIAADITLVTGETYPVDSVLYYDDDIDIAVFRVGLTSKDGKETVGFSYLPTARRNTVRNGDVIYTIGNPLGLGLAISSGIVSDTHRQLKSYQLPCILNTADISHGSSGGALLNVYGQAVGVTTGAYSFGNNMYLAVPIDPALDALYEEPALTLQQVADQQAKADKAAEKAKN